MKKNRKWNTKLGRYEYLATADEVAQARAKYDADQAAALVDPRPALVSLPHFIERDLKSQSAAGQCIVTMLDPIAGEARPPIVVVDVKPSENTRKCFDIIAADGKAWTRISTMLTVQWANAAAQSPTIDIKNGEGELMDNQPIWVNGKEVEPVIDSFTCDHCGRNVETWCGKCYCCTMHCTCGKADGNTPVTPNGQPPSRDGGNGISMSWLYALAAYAADQVNRFWYYPLPEYDFVSDADYVISIDDSGEWLTVWVCGETKIHVSQLDEPITKRNDPDAAFENSAWNDYVAGDRGIKPSRVI